MLWIIVGLWKEPTFKLPIENKFRVDFRGDFMERKLLDQFVSVKRAEPMKIGSILYINQPRGLHQMEWIKHLGGNYLAIRRKHFSPYEIKHSPQITIFFVIIDICQ